MKVFTKRPKLETLIAHGDHPKTYEIWVLVPELVGTATAEGVQRIVTDDGKTFKNLRDAGEHLKGDRK